MVSSESEMSMGKFCFQNSLKDQTGILLTHAADFWRWLREH